MSKKEKDETEVPGVPALALDPPTEPPAMLPGPQPEPTEEEPKRRRRRKKAAPVEPPPDGVSQAELDSCEEALAFTFTVVGKVVAKRRGAHWELDKEEAATLGHLWTLALAPYLPKIGAAVPWATALVVTGTMIVPRIEEDRRLADAPPTGPQVVP